MENKEINIEKISEMIKDNIEGVSIDEVMEVLKMCKAQGKLKIKINIIIIHLLIIIN